MTWTDFPCIIVKRRDARIVWEKCHGKLPKDVWVLHYCDERYCKQLEHLFLGTAHDNTWDAMRKGRIKLHPENLTKFHPQVGEKNGRAKLTPDTVWAIRAHPERANCDIAFDLGVTASLVCAIRKGRVWKHLL